MRVDQQRLVLLGYGSRDANGVATHRPVEVSYEIDVVAGRNWLIRSESLLGSDAEARRELVAYGVSEFRVTRLEDEDVEEELLESGSEMFFSVPSQLRCSLIGENRRLVAECVHLQPRAMR